MTTTCRGRGDARRWSCPIRSRATHNRSSTIESAWRQGNVDALCARPKRRSLRVLSEQCRQNPRRIRNAVAVVRAVYVIQQSHMWRQLRWSNEDRQQHWVG